RTDFKLPDEHFIKEFVLDVPSLGPDHDFVTPDELEVMINNIYNNVVRRDITGGRFFVYPVDAWSPEAWQKIEILEDDYQWDVRLDGNIYDFSEAGRARQDLEARREKWLREKFPGNKRVLRRAHEAVMN